MEDTPLSLVHGESKRVRYRLSDVAADGSRVPRPLTGLEVRGQARDKDGNLLLDLTPHFTVEPGGQVGVFELFLSGATTRGVLKGGRYDIFVSDVGVQDVDSLRVVKGPLQVEKVNTLASG